MFLRLLKIINWFLTVESSAPIVEEPATEKTTMNTTTEDIVAHVRDWSLERAADKSVSRDDARAIIEEFCEWIDPEDDEIEVYSFESKN